MIYWSSFLQIFHCELRNIIETVWMRALIIRDQDHHHMLLFFDIVKANSQR